MSALTDAIKGGVDIVDVASRYVKLKKSGSNFTALSPFKKERTPSFVVSPQKQIFKCFSTGIGGNVITLIMELEKVDFMDAVKMLAEIGSIDISSYLENYSYDKDYGAKKESIKRMNSLIYEWAVKQFPGSIAYTYVKEKRKLSDAIIDQFALGYVPDSFDAMIAYLSQHGFTPEDMIRAGLAKKNDKGLFAFFRHRLLFPIWDHMGNIIAFGARALSDKQQPKYLNTPDTVVYDKSKVLYGINQVKTNIKDFQKIIVVEGYMDVIAFAAAGFPIAVATCGTSLTKQHIQQMQRYTNDVLFLFDNDQAGLQATLRGLKLAYSRDVFPRIISVVGEAKDIDDVVREHGDNAKEIVNQMIDGARDGFEWVFEHVSATMDNSPVQQQKLQNMMFDLLQSIQSLTVQMHYLAYISDRLGISENYLKAQYTQYVKSGKTRTSLWQQEEKQPEGYRPKKSVLLAALVYNDFAGTIVSDSSLWNNIQTLLHGLHSYHQDELFSLIIQNTAISSEDIAKIEEEQLRREQKFAEFSDQETKDAFLRNMLLDELNRLFSSTMKLSSLSVEERQTFHKTMYKQRIAISKK